MPAIFRALLFLFALVGTSAQAAERFALVIGNSGYGTVPQLDNPANDARLIASRLETLGFTITLLIDAGQTDMKRGIAQFGRDLRQAGSDATGLFYYAGHGVQSYGTNYLLPVDVALSDAADLDLVAVEAQSVLRQMFSAHNKTNIVILDACRNNPFTDIPQFNDNGLAEMQAPTGTFLAYATAPGGVALDGTGANSPFTQSLAAAIATPGLAIEQMFKKVRVDVLAKTNGAQTPWDTSSLTSNFMFAAATVLSAKELEAQQVWQSVRVSRDPVQIMLFLRGYPDSSFADEAKKLLADAIARELNSDTPTAPKPVAQGPSEAETAMFEATQSDPSIASYQAFLQSYPDGVFSEIVQQELVALEKKAGKDPVGKGVPVEVEPTPAPAEPAPVESPDVVTFTQALISDMPQVSGRSIADLILSSPAFPPIEGLPEEYWKDQQCSNCHQWTAERLCTQANSYLSLNMQRSLDKQHPFGGELKRNLKIWAAGGCK